MQKKNSLFLGIIVLLLMAVTVIAQNDNNNMKWQLAWTSPATLNESEHPVVGNDVPVPYRFYNSEAWFDFDGDGNLEFYCEDQDPYRGYVYEADGNNQYVYRWHIDYFINDSTNLLRSERSSHGTDCDGDGADELIHQHTCTITDPEDPNYIPSIRVFKHEAGSAQFLPDPMNWTVAWYDLPTGREDNSFRPEYYTDAGDFDNDGKGEFAINYKRNATHHFAIVEVTPPLTPEEVEFKIELMLDKEEYMKPGVEIGNGYNSCRIDGEDLDGDGRAEFFLLNRETPAVLPQADYYVDCVGPDTYNVHGFFKDDEIVFPVPYVRIGENYTFIDLDHDGVKEMVTYAKGLTEDVNMGIMSLWVGKLNPSDPAHVVNMDSWYLVATVDQMLGLEPGTYSGGGGWIEAGDADKDGFGDVYIGAGADGLVIDAEFVGDDLSDVNDYNFYPVFNMQTAMNDTINGYHSARSAIGDGDSDGQTDIVLWNKVKGETARPGIWIMEFETGEWADKDNNQWRLAWTSPATLNESEHPVVGNDVPVPYRFYNSEAWFDFDGDGNKEFYCEDQDPYRGYVYEADGNDNYVYRWHIDYFINDSTNLLRSERSSHGTDCDGDGADELIHQHTCTITDPEDPNYIPSIRVFKHEAGSAQFLPDPMNWTVAWYDLPTGREDNSFRPEYYTDAGDFDNDGKGEFAINYKRNATHHFAIVEVTPPLTPEEVEFKIELMLDKEEYMKPGVEIGNGYNSCRIDGEDLDGDGRAEFFLLNRETPAVLPQADYYVDCVGPDTYNVHGFFKDDEIVFPVPYVRIGENYTFIDLDHDGVKEMVTYAKGLTEDVNMGIMSLWVGKLNPSDPAHVVNMDSWYLVATVDQMLGLEPGTYSGGGGWIEAGDADKDGFGDVYIGAGADGLVIDAEFVGDDLSDVNDYNFYPVFNMQTAMNDTINGYHSARSAIGDGDSDGQTDIVLWNKVKGETARPGIWVIEFGQGVSPNGVDANNGDATLPVSFSLNQNYPNPFNPTTTISYTLEKMSKVQLDIYDINGRLVKTLFTGQQGHGNHQVVWDATDFNSNKVATGVYFYSLVVNSSRIVKKMTLLK